MRVLVVDDSEDSRDLTEGVLQAAGCADILTAGSGWEALKVLDVGCADGRRPAADLALLDIVMPEMDGVEACARIRTDERYAELPIIMLTSLDDMDSLADAFAAGATDYLTKPVKLVELMVRVRAALHRKQELDRRGERERELLSFVSNWGERRAEMLIDEATGLFVGEAAEAYLAAAGGGEPDGVISILALRLDRFDAYRARFGEAAGRRALAQVARVVRGLAATFGSVAAAYDNGTIVLVAPELAAASAHLLGETLCTTIGNLRLSDAAQNTARDAATELTASVAAVTGSMKRPIERVDLLTQAISRVEDAVRAGGNRVLAQTL
jgi:phosphoserine phosphatase RsbU/P